MFFEVLAKDAAGRISESCQTPHPIAPKDKISRAGKPLAPTIGPALRQIAARGPLGPFWPKLTYFYFCSRHMAVGRPCIF